MSLPEAVVNEMAQAPAGDPEVDRAEILPPAFPARNPFTERAVKERKLSREDHLQYQLNLMAIEKQELLIAGYKRELQYACIAHSEAAHAAAQFNKELEDRYQADFAREAITTDGWIVNKAVLQRQGGT